MEEAKMKDGNDTDRHPQVRDQSDGNVRDGLRDSVPAAYRTDVCMSMAHDTRRDKPINHKQTPNHGETRRQLKLVEHSESGRQERKGRLGEGKIVNFIIDPDLHQSTYYRFTHSTQGYGDGNKCARLPRIGFAFNGLLCKSIDTKD